MSRGLGVIAFLLVVTAVAQAQTPITSHSAGTIPGTVTGQPNGVFFALSVADVNLASRWYQEKLGFRMIVQGEAPNKIAKFALLEGDGTIIELIQRRDAKSRAILAPETKGAYQVHGIFKVGMVVKDIDAVYAEIKKRGVPIDYELMPTKDIPMRSFSIRDVEGNMIQFFGK